VRQRLLGLLAASAIAACHHNTYLSEVPEDVERVALLKEARTGEVLSVSALRRYSKNASRALAFKLEGAYDVLRIVGFTAVQIATLEPLPEDVESIPLSQARGCDPMLPAPSWAARLDSAGAPLEDATAAPALTAPWLADRCPIVLDRIDIDARCVESRCQPAIDQRGCELSLNLSACQIGNYRGRIDYRGSFCGETAEAGCSFAAHPDDVFASIACTSPIACDIEIAKDAAPPPLRTSTITVIEAAVPRAPGVPPGDSLQSAYRLSGYFSDFAVLDDRIAVSTHDGRYLDDERCRSSDASRIALFDPGSLLQIGTSTAPPCLMRLLERPAGFLGVFGSGAAWKLGRFSPSGRLGASAPIALDAADGRTYFAEEVLFAAATEQAVILFSWEDAGGRPGHTLVAIGEAGAPQAIVEDGAAGANGLAISDDGKLAFVVEVDSRVEQDFVRVIDVRSHAELDRIPLPTLHSTSNQQVAFHGPSGAFLISSPFEDPAVFLLEGSGFRGGAGRRLPLNRDFGPYASALHPSDENLALVGAVSLDPGAPRTSAIAVYDPHAHLFLPGLLPAGFGPPTAMKRGLGRTWVALPWEAKLLRIESR
jgi:hypothetical protein